MLARKNRPVTLLDMSLECVGYIVHHIQRASDDTRPFCRSLLRWSQVSKDTQRQLSFWTARYAKPEDHAPQAFAKAFASNPPILPTLSTARKFAPYLSPDLLFKIGFSLHASEVSFDPRTIALSLLALNEVKDQLKPGVRESFLQAVAATLMTKGGMDRKNGRVEIERVMSVCRFLLEECGIFVSGKRTPKSAYPAQCIDTLVSLPPSLKSIAMYVVLAGPILVEGGEFKERFIESAHLFVPRSWDEAFMKSMRGTVALKAGDLFLRIFGATSEQFVVAYAEFLGHYLESLPIEKRNFRLLGEGLSGDKQPSYEASYAEFNDDGFSTEQVFTRAMLDRIFFTLYKGRTSDWCRQAFVTSFVNNGLMTEEELRYLLQDFSAPFIHIRSFPELAMRLQADEDAKDKESRGGKNKCVVS